ncbi:sporulation integral membrane protein YlbJ [Paludifilum halophilum]|uniref:Sporulation integral membrane protein YlbJ n=1 Tax=Paludifilum halophilum TaxID=1642702 RepID=A0A235B2A3_9BACL|nr:sporulation integral membrane protein YlbJ [Paludifilum halophilum]OYD06438.1 sporulation integral membrane protein YlbJ [Paludifilum halophilum]
MRQTNTVLHSQLRSVGFGIVALFLVLSMILYPEQAFNSSLKGLKVWWDVVFPALLPFFIASEILMGFGVVHFLGVLLEPLMRPLFRVPGAGGFVMAMGLASGYPIGAKLTARLREQKLISRTEGERLVSFTNTADPLFMFGAVAVGFFHDVGLGVAIAIAHYVSSFLLGLLMRFHEPAGPVTPPPEKESGFFLWRALKAMHKARLEDGRSLGQLMGDAITSSLNSLMLVGGFIIMFSVIIDVLGEVGITGLLATMISGLFHWIQFPAELASSVISGMFEITLGAQIASQAPPTVEMAYKIAIVGAITAWSGFSVHAQVASLLSKTDIRYTPYFVARVIHGFLAGWVTLILWKPISQYILTSDAAVPAFLRQIPDSGWIGFAEQLPWIGWKMAVVAFILAGTGILLHTFAAIRMKHFS